MKLYATGAPNGISNDFVLTVLNDEQCYFAFKHGVSSAADLYRNIPYLNSLNLDELDFPWINQYLEERISAAILEDQ